MRRVLIIAGLLMMAGLATGCYGTAAKQAYYGVTGASARYLEIKSMPGPVCLDRFKTVAVQTFDPSPMLSLIPPGMPGIVQSAVIQRLMETKAFDTVVRDTGRANSGLLIRGQFMDYDPGDSALRAVGFGVDPFLTAQIEFVDAATGQSLGIAMVTGTVKSVARTGPREIGDGIGKAIKGLVERHHTKIDEHAAEGPTKSTRDSKSPRNR